MPPFIASNVPPEHELLLQCARVCVISHSVGGIPPVVERVTDWSYLFRLASRHGVTPLVSHVLSQIDSSQLPTAALTELQSRSRKQIERSLHQTGLLAGLLALLERNGVPAVPFKGPALARSLYGDVTLRESVDLDILVRRQDVVRAKDVLLSQGYTTDLPHDLARQAAYLRARHEVHFTSPDGTCLIELHQALLAPFYSVALDYGALWERLERQPFYGEDILALRPGDLLLALCAHATKHSWSRLAWICDVGRLLEIADSELDWPHIMSCASALGTRRIVLLGVLLGHDVLGARAPEHVLQQARRDNAIGRLARAVARSLLGDTSAGGGHLRSHLFFLQARERVRDRFTYCARLAFLPNEEDCALLAIPDVLSPLYYPLHVGRVAGKYGRIFLKGMC